jgi:hypothetical protein
LEAGGPTGCTTRELPYADLRKALLAADVILENCMNTGIPIPSDADVLNNIFRVA